MTYTPVPYFNLFPSPHLAHAPPLPSVASVSPLVPELPWPCLAVPFLFLSHLGLAAWRWVLYENPVVAQSLKKFPAFCGTHPISLRSILISSHLFPVLPSHLFPVFLPKLCMHFSPTHATYPDHLILLECYNIYLALVHKNETFHGSSSKSTTATSFICEVLGWPHFVFNKYFYADRLLNLRILMVRRWCMLNVKLPIPKSYNSKRDIIL
jgi:hypothetical protein